MNLTPEQEILLRSVKIATDAYRQAQIGIESRIRLLVQQEIASYRDSMDREIRAAFNAGIPKRQIHLNGMGSSASGPLYDSLKRTDLYVSPNSGTREKVLDRLVLTDDGSIRVTLAGEELENACRVEDWALDEAEALGFDQLDVKLDVAESGWRSVVAPVDFLPQYGRRHPISAWLESHQDELLSFYDEATK